MSTIEELKKFVAGFGALEGRKPKRHDEDRLQESCVRWFNLRWPRYRLLLHHSPNEGLLPKGAAAGAKRKAMGVRAGFPDLVLMLPGGGHPYLAVELKTDKGRQSFAQKSMQADMEAVGALYVVVRSVDEFMRVVGLYMESHEAQTHEIRFDL